ncbi:MAG: hypothetical protein GXO24_02555 [Chlorobi bacterium]|nr:hypothetical protein [Chlorobiota bacterium]
MRWKLRTPVMLAAVFWLVAACGTGRKSAGKAKPEPGKFHTVSDVGLDEVARTYRSAYGRTGAQYRYISASGLLRYSGTASKVEYETVKGRDFLLTAGGKVLVDVKDGRVQRPAEADEYARGLLLIYTGSVINPVWEHALRKGELKKLAPQEVNGLMADVYVWAYGGHYFLFYVGRAHHYIIRKEYAEATTDKTLWRMDFSDFRRTDGTMIPYQWFVTDNEAHTSYKIFWHKFRLE